MSKESFKSFIKNRPELATSVMNGKNTWQSLYELYDIYGEDSTVWNQFTTTTKQIETTNKGNFQDIVNIFKNMDLETLQRGVNGLEKAVSLLSDLTSKDEPIVNTYQERPINKYYMQLYDISSYLSKKL